MAEDLATIAAPTGVSTTLGRKGRSREWIT